MPSCCCWRLASLLLAGGIESGQGQLDSKTKTRNILLVTADGVRLAGGFRRGRSGVVNRDSVAQSLLDTVKKNSARQAGRASQGPHALSLERDRQPGSALRQCQAGSEAKVTNGRNFSYPGYNEIFTGVADPAIDSNDKVNNPNVTVLEWLNRQDAFRGRVAAYGSWDVFPFILNQERSGIKVVAGWNPSRPGTFRPRTIAQHAHAETPRMWEGCCFDSFTFHAALEHLKRQGPRVLYIGLGETDEFAHAGRYDQYLLAAHRVDQYLKSFWETVQSLPEYRGTTTMIVTTDHGRGDAPVEWKSHGAKIKGSERIWIAVIGPDTPALGERKSSPP